MPKESEKWDKDNGSSTMHEFTKRTKSVIQSNPRIVKQSYKFGQEYLKYPKEFRSDLKDRRIRIQQKIIKRLAKKFNLDL